MNFYFHIITDGRLTSKGNFIGRDTNRNAVFIDKHLINSIGYCENEHKSFPIFGLSTINTYTNISGFNDGFYKNFNRLTCYFISKNFYEIVKILSECEFDIIDENEKKSYLQRITNLQFFCNTFFNFQKYVLNFHNNESDEPSEITTNFIFNSDLHFVTEKYQVEEISSIFKNTVFKNIELNNIEWQSLGVQSDNYLQVYKKGIFPYFKEKYLYSESPKNAKCKIVTLNELKEFNCNLEIANYINQFYYWNDSIDFYDLESINLFHNRCQEFFNTPYVYSLLPFILSKTTKEKLEDFHKKLIMFCEILQSNGIYNFIILGPRSDDECLSPDYQIYLKQEFEESEKKVNENDWSDFDGWEQLSNQEMRMWDTETGGSWRIENNLD